MIQPVHGIILNSRDLSENDKRVTLYTLELGKIKANVLGVKKTISKLRGFSLPFCETKLQVYLHGGKRSGLNDPGKIIGGEFIQDHSRLREDWDRMIQASAVCEILDVMTQPLFANALEYKLLALTLNQLETSPNPALVRCRFTLGLLKILGYSLRYHSVWSGYSQSEKNLVNSLSKWDTEVSVFSEQEELGLVQITSQYLLRYLSYPLKTDLFIQKCSMAQAG